MSSLGRKIMVFVLCSSHVCIIVTPLLFLAPQIHCGFPNFTLNSRNLEITRHTWAFAGAKLTTLRRELLISSSIACSWGKMDLFFFFFRKMSGPPCYRSELGVRDLIALLGRYTTPGNGLALSSYQRSPWLLGKALFWNSKSHLPPNASL